jgi:hypothetical protein
MSNWDNYTPEESTRIGAGSYRCEVLDTEETVSKSSGLPMIVVTLLINGSNIKVKNYFPKNQYFNRNITSFFDAFNIERGDFQLLGWVGAIGAAKFKEDEKGYLKVQYFLNPDQAEDLPTWIGDVPERQSITDIIPVDDDDDDLPF